MTGQVQDAAAHGKQEPKQQQDEVRALADRIAIDSLEMREEEALCRNAFLPYCDSTQGRPSNR